MPVLEAAGVRAQGGQDWFVLADAGLLLQRHPQPGDHSGRTPEDPPERDPEAAGAGNPDARARRAGVSQVLQSCRAPARRSRRGAAPASPTSETWGSQVGCGNRWMLPNRRAGLVSPALGQPRVPGMVRRAWVDAALPSAVL